MIRNRIRIIKQKRNEKNCGQLTMAMLTGKTKEEMISIYGHASSTNMREHNSILDKLNIKNDKFKKVDNRKRNIESLFSNVAILRVKYDNLKMGHVVLLHNNKVFDCYYGEHDSLNDYLKYVSNETGRKVLVSHFINIYENK
jgi:hypothetical protein